MSEEDISRMEKRLSAVEVRVNELNTKEAVAIVQRDNTNTRLSEIEDTLKWLVRLIIGGLLLGGITFALQGGLVGA